MKENYFPKQEATKILLYRILSLLSSIFFIVVDQLLHLKLMLEKIIHFSIKLIINSMCFQEGHVRK